MEETVKKIRRTIGIIIDTAASFAIYALIALLVLFIAGQVRHYYDVGYGVFSQVSKDAKGTGITAPVVVTEGMKAADLAQQLEEEGLIASAGTFLLQEKVSDYAGIYKPGTYILSSEMTTEEMMQIISGTVESPYALPEEGAAQEGAAVQEGAAQEGAAAQEASGGE